MDEGVNPKDLIGVTKAPLRLVPPALAISVAPVMALGARKYGPYNWRQYPVKLSVYMEAIERHTLAAKDGEWLDPESGQPHVCHVAACVAIIIDAKENGTLVEDWPVSQGPAAAMLSAQDGANAGGSWVDVSAVSDGGQTFINTTTGEEHYTPFQGEFGDIDVPLHRVPPPEDRLPLLDDPSAQVARRIAAEEADCE